MPPEMLLEERHFLSCDWYSYGITIYALLRGMSPFSPKLTGNPKIKEASLAGKMDFESKYFSADAKDFIEKLCKKDHKERIGFEAIKEHSFLADFKGKWKEVSQHGLQSVYEPVSWTILLAFNTKADVLPSFPVASPKPHPFQPFVTTTITRESQSMQNQSCRL